MRRSLVRCFISCAILLAGCKDSPTSPAAGGTMKLSVLVVSGAPGAPKIAPAARASAAAVDSVVLTRARLVLRDIRFHTSDDSLDYRSAPMVLLLQPGAPLQQIAVQGVPPGIYREVEFEVHRVESTDVAAMLGAERAAFTDFLQGDRSSIIIEGIVYPAGGAPGASFVFRSRMNERQEFEFSPGLVVDNAQVGVNVTLRVNAGTWFRSEDGLTFADPRDGTQAQLIENNLKASLRIFEDNDLNGEDD